MSADNWSKCPVCRSKQEAEATALKEKTNALYGVVSPEQYAEALENAKRPLTVPLAETVREDYGQWLDPDGTWHVKFRAHCKNCGTETGFSYSMVTEFSGGSRQEIQEVKG
jgi:hypothetical protein